MGIWRTNLGMQKDPFPVHELLQYPFHDACENLEDVVSLAD